MIQSLERRGRVARLPPSSHSSPTQVPHNVLRILAEYLYADTNKDSYSPVCLLHIQQGAAHTFLYPFNHVILKLILNHSPGASSFLETPVLYSIS